MNRWERKWEALETGECKMCSVAPAIIAAGLGAGANLLGGLFGGGDDSDQAMIPQTSTSTNDPWAPVTPYVEGIMGDSEKIYDRDGYAPGVNPLQLLGRENALGYGENVLPGLTAATQNSWLRGLDPGIDPYVGMMIQSAQNDMVQDYQRNIMPGIQDRGIATGGFGGSRQGVAQGIAAEGLMEQMGDVSTRLLSNAYGQGLGQQRAAWNAAPNMLGLGFGPAQVQQDVGQQYQGDATQDARNLQGHAGMINPYFNSGFGGSSSTGQVQNPAYNPQNPFNNALSGAATGLGLLNMYNQMQTPPAGP